MEKLIFLLSMQFFALECQKLVLYHTEKYCDALKNLVFFIFWLPKSSLKPEKKLAFSYKPTGKDSTKF